MTIPVITFFNNKGGVGKTSLVYHVAWMLSEMEIPTLAVDLDPQSNLTAAFLDDDQLENLWDGTRRPSTVYRAVEPLKRGIGDIKTPEAKRITDYLSLVPGDMALSDFEDDLSQVWPKCLDKDERAFRVISSFWRVIQGGAQEEKATLALIDIGPNLGAINRATLIASDYVIVPLGPDLFSLQGLRNLGPTLRAWREGWKDRLEKRVEDLELPAGDMTTLGYVVMQHSVRHDRPVKSDEKWISRIPDTYREFVLDKDPQGIERVSDDPNCFTLLKHYRSLMPMAQEARKPMFLLKPADGALGAHMKAVQDAYSAFESLTNNILEKVGIQHL